MMEIKENEGFKAKMRLFLQVFFRLEKVRKISWYMIPLMIINVLLGSVQPYFYKIFADKIEFVIKTGDKSKVLDNLWQMSLILLGLMVLYFILRFIYRLKLAKTIYIDWVNYLIFLGKNFIDMPISYHINTNVGEKTKIFDKGASGLFWAGFMFLNDILPQFLTTILFFGLGCYINLKMTLVSFLFLPICIALVSFLGIKLFKKNDEVDVFWTKSFGRFSDSMINIAIIKTFVKEKNEVEILFQKFNEATLAQFEIEYLWALLMNYLYVLNSFGQIIGMIYGAYLTIEGEMSIGSLFMFMSINAQVYSQLGSIFWSFQNMISYLTSFGKTENIINSTKETDDGMIENIMFADKIEFKNVSFNYPNIEREVLKNISFSIKKGQKVALVGHTGSGKSTMVNLLTRFYKVEKGNIFIDKTNVKDFRLGDYRRKFAQVFQDNTLFNDTILHNLQYVNPDATFEGVKAACEKAQILTFIESLEGKFDTMVGERGLKLSGGEKQRLSIARAILADPEILILDEATSALDSKTEFEIQQAFENLMKGRTSVIIAHRLSTIQKADVIFVFDKGKLVGSGTHKELCLSNPIYKEMVDYQNHGFID